ncbi:alpha/beta hydrolase-fold protein [Aestuariibaculum sp. M13]|uniref:alpha/beta hydrolase n=1 Tax=Aestuariibaculum sp. M13 TaxID=2967132 RepID=UPI002159C96A|nr:alpha/beta hydrolase-fold protein [Aestuariibaculum sp. M13]MCR8666206.1 alpha/beta hydrolase-fold protein [Aestuariibaculum sp. M13]
MRLLYFLIFLSIHSIAISQVSKDSLNSEVFGNKRTFQVYHPEVSHPTPLVIVLDGHNLFDLVKTNVDYLTANDQMPHVTIIGLKGAPREIDFTPIPYNPYGSKESMGGGAPAFLKFLDEELIPYLEKKYQLTYNRTLIGHSLGGLFTYFVMIDNPNVFTNYVAISPSFFWGDDYMISNMESKLDKINLKNKHLIHSYENPFNSEEYRYRTLETLPDSLYIKKTEKLFDVNDTGLEKQFFYYPNSNHVSMVPMAISDAIVNLFYFYPVNNEELAVFLEKSPKDLVQYIVNHFKMLSEKLGYQILPSERFLRGYAGFIDHFMKDKKAYSTALKEKADELYPVD